MKTCELEKLQDSMNFSLFIFKKLASQKICLSFLCSLSKENLGELSVNVQRSTKTRDVILCGKKVA